jgi:tripartite-type tricarboxylate transporter receptor subunit TctC
MGSHVSAPVLTPGVTYEPLRDFVPVGVTAHAPAVIVARKDFPAKDLGEFVAHLKKNPGEVKQAHGGIGASSHMACVMFNQAVGVEPLSVAYRGTGPAMNDLLGGHVDFLCEQAVSVSSHVGSGAVRAFAVSADQRLPTLPNVPTAKEAGLDYRMSIWAGIFAPKGTPAPVVDRLAKALDNALDDEAVRKRIIDLGGAVPEKAERTPAQFAKYVQAEIERWAPILKSAKEASEKTKK